MNSSLVNAIYPSLAISLLICAMSPALFRFDEDVGGGIAGRGDVLHGARVRRVQGRYAEQSAGRHLGNTDYFCGEVVQLEFRADSRFAELLVFGVVDDDESVVGINILDGPVSRIGRQNKLASSRPRMETG